MIGNVSFTGYGLVRGPIDEVVQVGKLIHDSTNSFALTTENGRNSMTRFFATGDDAFKLKTLMSSPNDSDQVRRLFNLKFFTENITPISAEEVLKAIKTKAFDFVDLVIKK